nr:PQQ-binding-like beta-propeller repeat protein [Pseudoxanthomonas sp.]
MSLFAWALAHALAIVAVTPVGTPSAKPVYARGWSATHADASNSDYSPVAGASRITHAWSRSFGGLINLGPTSDGEGRLYLTTSGPGCRLHALDRTTGRTIWCTDAVDRLAVASSPLLDAERNLYLADGAAMHSFRADGGVRWRSPITGFPLSAQFTPDGDLIFVTHVGVVYRLDRGTGKSVADPIALIPNPAFDSSSGALACMRGTHACPGANTPAVDARGGRLIFTFWTPGAAAAGIRSMKILADAGAKAVVADWRNDTLPGGSAASPSLSADGTRIYLTDNAHRLRALDIRTGEQLWSIDIGYPAGGSPSVSPEGIIMPAGGGEAPLMAVRDLGDRPQLLWRRQGLRNRGIATQAAQHRAYATVAGNGGALDLVVVDTRTGEILDRDALPGKPMFTVGTTVDTDGTVYVPSIRGTLHAFRPER